jgi:group II intron reverse transcriptase/maturase
MGLSRGKTPGTPSPDPVSTKLRRIAEQARKSPDMAFTTLAHHIDVDLLRAAWRKTRKDGAVGVDGQTAAKYEVHLEDNLRSLMGRLKSGRYKAPPVKRTYIPKADGSKTRPIGIPTFEDKVLQRAVTMVLEAVYEQDFLPCNYGFRPGRSCHQALQSLWEATMQVGGGWVLEVDIQGFFDTLDHGHLRTFLDRRVRDGVLRRAIDKWLKAGVLEKGCVWHPEYGTPQGGVVSPLLANIYLHEVLDRWFEAQIRPRLRGRAFLIRYADDAVIVFSHETDARGVLNVLPKRFGKYGLTLHPEKTRLLRFRRPPRGPLRRKNRPESFDFLGFTHLWDRSRKGYPVVRRKTARSRFARTLRTLNVFLRTVRHDPISQQHAALVQKLRGHDAYFGITGNHTALAMLRYHVRRLWRKWLNRRSQRARMTWEKFLLLVARYPLPPPRVVHSVYRS